jgi:hypothetical protein
MAITEFSLSTEFQIPGIAEPTIIDYFVSLNAGEFTRTAGLFNPTGIMLPPFESEIVGIEAIANYLQQEAQQIKAEPGLGTSQNLTDDRILVQINGKAYTSWCSVNTRWLFTLNEKRQILALKVQLLASPSELFALQRLLP